MKKYTNKIKQILTFHSIASKITVAFIVMGLFLLGVTQIIVANSLLRQEEELMTIKEESDIQYIEDFISPGGSWTVKDGTLYKGFTPIGDGTKTNAFEYPFLELKRKTGTNFYTAIHTDYVKKEILKLAQQNNNETSKYLRVAGSIRDSNGNSIVGTFAPTEVSDFLSKFDTYHNEVNVQGVQIFSYYKNLRDRDGNIIGYIVAGRDIKELKDQAGVATNRTIGILAVTLATALIGMILIIHKFTETMENTRKYLKQIGTGNFPKNPLIVNSHDEMEDMANSINEMTLSLKERQRLGTELSLAKDIQTNMLPTDFPAFPDRSEFNVFATMDPAKEVGGDLYDFFMIDDKNVAVVIADVSGKGIPAAFFMAITKTLIKIHAHSGLSPADIFTKVNAILCERNTSTLFVTAWMGVLNLEAATLTYVNAGHNPPLIMNPNTNFEFVKIKPCFVLAGLDSTTYTQTTISFPPGSRLYLYTDGITEATNKNKELYGENRLQNFLNQHKTDQPVEILKNLRIDINQFVGDAEQFDDITMLMLDYIHKMPPSKFCDQLFHATNYELQQVLDYVEKILRKHHCNTIITMRMIMVTEEIFNNIVKYAYSDTGDVKISVCVTNNTIILRFTDHGIPFDPTVHIINSVTTEMLKTNSLDGLGLFLVKNSVDSMIYKFENGQNILTITKNLL